MTDTAHPLIVIDPDIRGGIPTLLGTRLSALEIADEAGAISPDDLYAQYPSLTPELLAAAVAYAAGRSAIRFNPNLISFKPTDEPVMMQIVYGDFVVPGCIMFVLDPEYGWTKMAAIRMISDRLDMMSAHAKLEIISVNDRF